nr:hypothetical protein BaRGS_005852 [Batillaria attramentaria]
MRFSVVTQSFCSRENAISRASEIFQHSTDQAVVGVASYELHTTLALLAEVYGKPYISANSYTSPEAYSHAFSLYPAFYQTGGVLETLLTKFKWQETVFIVSDQPYWLAMSKDFFMQLTDSGFEVKARSVLASPVQMTHATEALQNLRASTKDTEEELKMHHG